MAHTTVKTQVKTIPAGGQKSYEVKVAADEGLEVVSGGVQVMSGWEVVTLDSHPVDNPYGWRFSLKNPSSSPVAVTLYIVCLNV